MSDKFSAFVIKALVDTITGGAGNDNNPAIGIYAYRRELSRARDDGFPASDRQSL